MKPELSLPLISMLLAAGCSSPVPQTSSETHFVSCDTTADCAATVGAGYSCRAGLCRPESDATSTVSTDGSAVPPRDGGGLLAFDAGPGQGCAITTAYSGDERCLEPPPSGRGVQLHYGPSSYDDPDVLAPFVLPPGLPSSDCVAVTLSNDRDEYVQSFHGSLRPGSIFALVNRVTSTQLDTPAPGPCSSATSMHWLMVPGPDAATTFGGSGAPPEHAGAALPLPARSTVEINLYAWNTTDHPLLREGWVNLYFADPATVTDQVSLVSFMGGLSMLAPAQSTLTVASGASDTCSAPDPRSVVLLEAEASPYVARHAVFLKRAGTSVREKIYESYDPASWDPLRYDSVTANPQSDPTRSIAGGSSGILSLTPGDEMSWECDVNNTTDGNLQYKQGIGGAVCNVWGYGVSTTSSTPWGCVF